MKIYDISQEVFDCKVFPGDPAPEREWLSQMAQGGLCNLTAFHMCAHNGTHVDAPYHFCREGKTVDQIPLENYVGMAYVTFCQGNVTAEAAREILKKAEAFDRSCSRRILIGGKAVLTLEAAEVFARARILLYGNESQTVGPEDAPVEVHKKILGAEIVLLEGIRLEGISEGAYFLCAAPVNLGGSEGAPCRALLIDGEAAMQTAI